MKKMIFVVVLVSILCLTGCSNKGATQFGNTKEIVLEDGEKFVHYNIKDDDIWVTTREMREEEYPEVYKIQQEKDVNLVGNGTIIIYETKDGVKAELPDFMKEKPNKTTQSTEKEPTK